MAIVFSIVLASSLLNFVAQFWEPARQVAFLGVMEYYQPAQVLQGGDPPFRDMAVLLSVGGLAWLLGGEVVARRGRHVGDAIAKRTGRATFSVRCEGARRIAR